MLRVLDLFSGIGGFSLGLERTGGFETVAFCEIDPFCRKVLAKHWPDIPIFEDVRKIDATGLGRIDCVTGGYPCQPFSVAGNRHGDQDDRHLWPAMFAVIKSVRPAWVIGENVAGHISMGLDEVLADLEGEGYACRPYVIPACAVDAPHRRDRVWIVAHAGCQRRRQNTRSAHADEIAHEGRAASQTNEPASDGERCGAGLVAHATGSRRSAGGRGEIQEARHEARRGGSERSGGCGDERALAHSEGVNSRRLSQRATKEIGRPAQPVRWLPEPGVGRVANGVPNRVDRLKSLGNAVVPQIPELIGRAILEAMKPEKENEL